MEFEAVNYGETSIDIPHIGEKNLQNFLFLDEESQRQECHA